VEPVQLPSPAGGRSPGGDVVVGRGHGEDFLGLKLMREGEDPRDVHWRKTAAVGRMVMRERARETRPDVTITLDVMRPDGAGDEWAAAFERRIRDVASRAVAHLKRGDRVAVVTTANGASRADRTVGADPLLRYLALIEPVAQAVKRVPEAAE
jgi:uncharacterized protein (DUF58 family)